MVEPEDYWRGHSDALTEVSTLVAEHLGDSTSDQSVISMADLGQIVLQVRALADAKPIPGVDAE